MSLHDYLTARERQILGEARGFDEPIARLKGAYPDGRIHRDESALYVATCQRTLLEERENALRRTDWTWLREVDASLARINAQITDYEGRQALMLSQLPNDEELERRKAAQEQRQREEQARRVAAEDAAQPIFARYAELDHLLADVSRKALDIHDMQREHRRQHSPVNPPGPTLRRLVYTALALQQLPESISRDVLNELAEWRDAEVAREEVATS